MYTNEQLAIILEAHELRRLVPRGGWWGHGEQIGDLHQWAINHTQPTPPGVELVNDYFNAEYDARWGPERLLAEIVVWYGRATAAGIRPKRPPGATMQRRIHAHVTESKKRSAASPSAKLTPVPTGNGTPVTAEE